MADRIIRVLPAMPDRLIRVALDEAAFRQLCAGQVVRLTGVAGDVVEMILSDIGTIRMLRAVLDYNPVPVVRDRGDG